MTHTPGPWTIDSDETPWTCGDCRVAVEYGEEFGHTEILFSISGDEDVICYCPWLPLASAEEQEQLRTRARLIAAAPDLLTALEWTLGIVNEMITEPEFAKAMKKLNVTAEPNLSQAQAAIAKARGE